MQSVVVSALAGAVFGLALAAPPGPMNAIIAEETVLRGWPSGFIAGLGAMSADAVFCGLTLLGVVGFVDRVPFVRGAMVGVGGLLMLYFATGAAVDARAATEFTATTDGGVERVGDGHGFRKAFALALTNPYQILFWLTAGVGMIRPGTLDVLARTPYVGAGLEGVLVVQTGSPAMLVGFFGGITLWITAFPGVLATVGERVDRFAVGVAWASAAVLAGFGVVFLADAAGTLL
jgi:threonine/homoserine/homoserine lactone efflux protein